MINTMNELEKFANKYGADKSSSGHYYTKHYDRLFNHIRNNKLSILEIGVQHGNSLRMWRDYFKNSMIYGIDNDKECIKHESNNMKIFIGDQSDHNFLKNVINHIGNIDIIIDDGSHDIKDITNSFNFLFDKLSIGGYYVIEDISFSKHINSRLFRELIDAVDLGGISGIGNRDRILKEFADDMKLDPTWFSSVSEITLYTNIMFILKG